MQPSHSSCLLLKVHCFDNEERHVITEILRKFALNTNQSINQSSKEILEAYVVCMRVHVLFRLFVFVCVEWCPTHIVLCFFLSSSCVPYIASFSGLSILVVPSVFSSVYWNNLFFVKLLKIILLSTRIALLHDYFNYIDHVLLAPFFPQHTRNPT